MSECLPPRINPCEWCLRPITRQAMRLHRRMYCPERPDLKKARALPGPREEEASAPTVPSIPVRLLADDPGRCVCGCGKRIALNRMYMHSIKCAHARAAGYKPPPVKVRSCQCGCGEEVLSRGVKAANFAHGHYDRWVWANREKRRLKNAGWRKEASLGAGESAEDTRVMRAIREEEARVAAEVERTAVLLEANRERSYSLWMECLSLSATTNPNP